MAANLLQKMLPMEILHQIIEELYTEKQSNLLPLALVSYDFYCLVIPVLYRSLQISLQNHHYEASRALLQRLSTCNTGIADVVRSIEVFGTSETHIPSDLHDLIREPQEACHSVVLNQLTNIVPRLKNLAYLDWRIFWDMPERLLLHLGQNCPFVRLGIGFSNLQHPHFDTIIERVGVALEKLDIILSQQDESQREDRKLLVAIERCPNLKTLNIQDFFVTDRLGNHPDPWLESESSTKLPRLSKLSLGRDIFGPQRPLRLQHLLKFGENGGWDQLEEVTLQDHYPLQALRGCEKTLRSISLEDASSGNMRGIWVEPPGHSSTDIENALVEICSRFECLKSLRLCGYHIMSFPLKALKICGEALRLLEVHTVTFSFKTPGWNPPIDILEKTRRYCPNIATLGVDLYRTNNDWPYEYLSALSGWPNLTDLILYAELNTNGKPPIPPVLDIAAAKQICQYVIDRKLGKPLRKMTIYRGDDDHSPEASHLIDYNRRITRATFHCTIVQRNGISEARVAQEGGRCFQDEWIAERAKAKETNKMWDARRDLGVEGGDERFLLDLVRRPSASDELGAAAD